MLLIPEKCTLFCLCILLSFNSVSGVLSVSLNRRQLGVKLVVPVWELGSEAAFQSKPNFNIWKFACPLGLVLS